MARVAKTGYMIVIDVGRSTSRSCGDQSFFEIGKEIAMRIMERNICSFPQDEVGLVLMGTDETSNQLNTEHESGYEHICEASDLQLPSWRTARVLENKVLRSNSDANWFDALIVAADFLRAGTANRSFKHLHIYLISALAMPAEVSPGEMRSLLDSLEVMLCRVHIISDQIVHSKPITNSTIFTSSSSGSFVDEGVKSEDRIQNENLLTEILQTAEDFTLTSIDAAHRCLGVYVPKPVRPTPWNSMLTIGTKLKFAISAYLLISEQKGLGPFKVTSAGGATANSVVTMRTQHFQNEKPIDLDMEDVIVGYMYGSTVVPYDNAIDMDYKSGEAGLTCLGFTASSNILDEYLSGKGTYLVMAKKGCAGSEERLTALVQAMMALNVVMVASKIYRKDTKPRLQTLLPTMHEQRYPCLVMLELVFQDEINLVRFPSFLTSKHEPSPEQYAAVDALIDSMNLMDAAEDEHGRSYEAFGLKETHNPNHQFLYRSVVHRAMHPNASLPVLGSDVSELVSVPKKLIHRSQAAVDEIKKVFPLEEQKRITRAEWLQRMAAMHLGAGDAATSTTAPTSTIDAIDDESERRVVLAVGTMTPAEDFDLLLRRGEKFVTVATQMQTVIFELLFTAMHTPVEKVIMALMMYRGEAQKLGPFRYNEWLTEFKQVLLDRRKHEFWEEVIVREKLGLIDVSESEMSTVSVDDANEFYRIPAATKSTAETIVKDDVDLDSLFEVLNG